MKRIHYAGTSFVTGDILARALMTYARALADTASSDIVEIPTVRHDGSPGRVELLMLPTSGMLFETEPTLSRDPVNGAIVDDLLRRAQSLLGITRPSEWQMPANADVPLYSDVHSIA
jgi:hypothetical protein